MEDIEHTQTRTAVSAEQERPHPNAVNLVEAIMCDDVSALERALEIDGGFADFYAMFALTPDGLATPHVAAANGAFQILEWCVRQPGVSIDAGVPGSGWSPAHFAAFNGHDKLCAMLKHHEANTDVTDNYGDTPCDVAEAAGNTVVVDVLGGNFAVREARRRRDEHEADLLREAKAYEEERLRQAQADRDAAEQQRLQQERKRERLQRMKQLRSKLELERLGLIQKWLVSRQAHERDFWAEVEWLFASQLLIASDLIGAEVKCRDILQQSASPDPEASAAVIDMGGSVSKRPKKKGAAAKGGRKGSVSGTGDPVVVAAGKRGKSSSVAAGDSPQPGHSTAADTSGGVDVSVAAETESAPLGSEEAAERAFEQGLLNDPELQLPVVQGVMTKEKKKELAKLRNKIERIKRERRQSRAVAVERFRQKCEDEQQSVVGDEAMMRDLLQVDWLLGMARIEQNDAFNDRRHTGDFVYHSVEPKCNCGQPNCKLGTCSWSCCAAGAFDAVGCAIVDDTAKAPYHPGAFSFHMEGCTCAEASSSLRNAPSGVTRETVRTMVELRDAAPVSAVDGSRHTPFLGDSHGSSSDEGGADRDADADDVSAYMGGRRGAGGGAALRQGRMRSGPAKFCNPGGTVWSCCGAVDPDSDGCIMWPRFLEADSVLLWPRFQPALDVARATLSANAMKKALKRASASAGATTPAVENALNTYCRLEVTGDHDMRVRHALTLAPNSTPTRCTAIGTLYRSADLDAGRLQGPLDGRMVSCFEVQVLECPPPSQSAHERLVVGFALHDSYVAAGATIGGEDGIGWWAHSGSVKGLGVATELKDGYGRGDIICVAVDALNRQLYFFKNRRFVGNCAFRPPANGRLVPAVTLIAGCRIGVDETMSRTCVPYVDEYVRGRAEADREQRLHGNAARYRSRIRDKFEIQRRLEQGNDAEDDSDEEARINFDV